MRNKCAIKGCKNQCDADVVFYPRSDDQERAIVVSACHVHFARMGQVFDKVFEWMLNMALEGKQEESL